MRRRDHTAVTVNEDDDYVVSSSSHEGPDSKAKYTSPDDLCLINDSCLRCGVCCCLRPCRRRGALDLYRVFMSCACCVAASVVVILLVLGAFHPTQSAYLDVDPFFAISPGAAAFERCTTTVRDVDVSFIGGDFLDGRVKDAEWCCRYCSHIGRCNAWTFVDFTSHCWLKDLGRERVKVARLEGHISGTNDVARHGLAHRSMLQRVAAEESEGAALVERLHREDSAELVVALTVIPQRLPHLAATLRSIRLQTAQPDRVLLVLPRTWRRFDDGAVKDAISANGGDADDPPTMRTIARWTIAVAAVEAELRKLTLIDVNRAGARLEIVRVEEDLGPATALLGALDAVKSDDDVIVTLEDDTGYGAGTLANLLRHHLGSKLKLRDSAVAHAGFILRRDNAHRGSLSGSSGGIAARSTSEEGGLLRPIGHENIEYVHTVSSPTQVEVAEGFRGVLYRRRFFLPPRVRSGAVLTLGATQASSRLGGLIRIRKREAIVHCANELIAGALYRGGTRTFVVPGTPDTSYWNVPISSDLDAIIGREEEGGGTSDKRYLQQLEQALLLEDLIAEKIFVQL